MRQSLNIGVLAVQGDVYENIQSTNSAMDSLQVTGSVYPIKYPDQISSIDGIIIPGGESTVIGQLSLINGSLKPLKEKIKDHRMPTLGTCAGMILLSKNAKERVIGEMEQPLLDILDINVERNAFGRQNYSFESDLSMSLIGIPSFKGVFIRAPVVTHIGKGVNEMARLGDKVVAVKQDNILATSFHPELSGDDSLHKFFVEMIQNNSNGKN